MKVVTLDHVYETLSAWTGVPAIRLRSAGCANLEVGRARQLLAEAVFGQDDAIGSAAAAIFRCTRLAPLVGERRPIWTALFAGPSGVGKSALAKALAQVYFGDAERHLIHIDLSDFADEHTIARLVGAPPGYKGHGDGGELTNALRRTPCGVLLLDEVEKAHPAVITQLLLPLLELGVVHDMNSGRTADASQFLVVLTSNLGASLDRSGPIGFAASGAAADADARGTIRAFLPPEVLGRIDDVIVFQHLSQRATGAVWAAETAKLEQRLAGGGSQVTVHIADQVCERLLDGAAGRIRAEGARAVRKVFECSIADRCLELIGDGQQHGELSVVPAEDDCIRFRFEPWLASDVDAALDGSAVSDGPDLEKGKGQVDGVVA